MIAMVPNVLTAEHLKISICLDGLVSANGGKIGVGATREGFASPDKGCRRALA